MEHFDCLLCGSIESELLYKDVAYRIRPLAKKYDLYRCKSCGLVFVFPPPTQQELEDVYFNAAYYADSLRPLVPERAVQERRILKSLMKLCNKGRMLDMGCGAGHFLYFAKLNGWETFGVEIAEHLRDFATRIYNLTVVDYLEEGLPFPNDYFDVITINGVIEHIPNPVRFLSLATNHLKPEGLLFILTQNINSWMHFVMRRKFPFLTPPEHIWYFSPKTVSIMLEKCGLKLLKILSRETITSDAGIRGICGLLGIEAQNFCYKPIYRFLSSIALGISFPLRIAAWKLLLGADMYIYAKKIQ